MFLIKSLSYLQHILKSLQEVLRINNNLNKKVLLRERLIQQKSTNVILNFFYINLYIFFLNDFFKKLTKIIKKVHPLWYLKLNYKII